MSEKKKMRVYEVSNAPFRSGSRRSLPWGGAGPDAPKSVKAKTAEQRAQVPFDEPGPGEYKLPVRMHRLKPGS